MASIAMMNYPSRDSYQSYPQQYAIYQTRVNSQQPDASALAANPYTGFHTAAQQQAAYPQPSRSPRPSPGSEEGPKPSLPSISNLLGMVDSDRPNQEQGARQQQIPMQQQQQPQPQAQPQPQMQPQMQSQLQPQAQQLLVPPPQQYPSVTMKMDQRPQIISYPPQDMNSNQRSIIPPTPPMRSDSVAEANHSPSTISTGSSLPSQPYYIGSALNNIEATHQRVAIAEMQKRQSVPSQPNTSPYGTSPYVHSAYTTSPSGLSSGAFYSPEGYTVSNLYTQRPLPSNFPPQAHHIPTSQSTPTLPTTNPWEHHHFINPSSQATYPQSQDRYICQTCNKAFSRPSSLKIHSHSHTGEKPFKCPHAGCGKAFSVRSNMKRHERGCHTGSARMMVDA